ncbi:unnamed protein product [Lactuca virosa]|uniref:SWIM-type domain-containing protein n=1 Tax=Lactuca virosa TaxID=75947 RepID=A0AAU9NDF9_9ASTR|nr:unnamed protein product [Lactuca virosa]
MVTMKLKGQGWNHYSVCPNIRTRLNILQNEQRHCQVVSCGGMKFERRKMDQSYIVDVTKKECSCRLWQLNGYGCVHLVATIAFLNVTPDRPYIDPLYLATFFHNTNKKSISGMNGMNMWPSTDFTPPLPPLKRRMPGRTTIKRIRDASERSGKQTVSKEWKKVSCGIFKEKGHNKTTCTQVPRPTKTNVTKKQKIMQTQESSNMQWGGEDDVMGDAVEPETDEVMRVNESEQVVRVNESEQVVRVNEAEELGRVNQVVRQVNTTGQPDKRKNSERILKLKLAKRVESEGSSVGSPMELD